MRVRKDIWTIVEVGKGMSVDRIIHNNRRNQQKKSQQECPIGALDDLRRRFAGITRSGSRARFCGGRRLHKRGWSYGIYFLMARTAGILHRLQSNGATSLETWRRGVVETTATP